MRVNKTSEYDRWFRRLRDLDSKFRIARYFQRLEGGHSLTGDYKSVGGKVIEVRFHFGPGYRVYLTQVGEEVVLLLVGGDKSTQQADIERAKGMAERLRKDVRK